MLQDIPLNERFMHQKNTKWWKEWFRSSFQMKLWIILMNGRKRHGESRNLETSRWTGIVVYRCLKYIGGGLDLQCFINRICKKGISGPGFSLHSDIVALIYWSMELRIRNKSTNGQRGNDYRHRDDWAELWKWFESALPLLKKGDH
jgi:hypothetical protein